MRVKQRLVLLFVCLLFLTAYGCAPPTSDDGGSSSSGTGGGGSGVSISVSGKLVVPTNILPRQARIMFAALSGDVLPGATVELLDSGETLIASTTSNLSGEYTFSDVPSGNNYIIHAFLGNINLYDIVPYVESDVDAGQADAASTALYVLASHYVFDTTNTITSFSDIDVGALAVHLESDTTLVDEVALALETFGDIALSGDVIADWVTDNEDTVLAAQAAAADEPGVSITVSDATLSVGDEFYVYLNVAFIDDLYGVDMGLVFDSTVIQVKDSSAGTAGIQPTYTQGYFLPSSEATLLVGFEGTSFNNLLVGISKTGVVSGNDGSGNLVRLTFEALATSSSSLICFDTTDTTDTTDSTSKLVDSLLQEIVITGWPTACQELTIQ